ncbi:hypothetical protein Tco_1375314 [Tanacetum coccineum]
MVNNTTHVLVQRTVQTAQKSRKAECSNCKFLAERIKTLEARISVLEGQLEMARHPENHTLESAGILHEIYQGMRNLNMEIAEYDFVSFDRRIPTKRSSLQATFIKHAGLPSMILDSDSRRYFVYNPYIDVFKMLPQFRVLSYVCTILAFDPTKSPHYKVVQVGCIVDHDRGYSIHIYSSQTGNWVAYDHSFSSYMFHDRFHQGIYWNNAIHWLQGTMHYRLDIADDPVITKIKLPDSVIVKYGDRQLFG